MCSRLVGGAGEGGAPRTALYVFKTGGWGGGGGGGGTSARLMTALYVVKTGG